jgi:hypothetical protein
MPFSTEPSIRKNKLGNSGEKKLLAQRGNDRGTPWHIAGDRPSAKSRFISQEKDGGESSRNFVIG